MHADMWELQGTADAQNQGVQKLARALAHCLNTIFLGQGDAQSWKADPRPGPEAIVDRVQANPFDGKEFDSAKGRKESRSS